MHKKIGVWGLGIVGKSVIRFLHARGHTLGAMDAHEPTPEDSAFLAAHQVQFYPQDTREQFFADHARIVPSPGIDLRPHQHQWLSELDIFHAENTVPLIAITGSLGKTSVTHLLSELLTTAGKMVTTGGNIGIGMLDTLSTPADYRVLEVSSFQLDITEQFAPDLAIITNLYENHLDRHGSLEAYRAAKLRMLEHQQPHQWALVPWELRGVLPHTRVAYFSAQLPTVHSPQIPVYYFDAAGNIVKEASTGITTLLAASSIPLLSFRINWLIIAAALDMLDIIMPALPNITLPEHRLQKVATLDGVTFYDDSKSTVPEATLAALDNLDATRTILLLGGISKGVNRQPLIAELARRKVRRVVTFGKEAAELAAWCHEQQLPTSAHVTLAEAVATARSAARPGDCVVLSPAGASYDLFAHYKERGRAFQALIRTP